MALHMVYRKSDGPEAERRGRPLEGARTRHQRPCRRPLRPERAALASWVTPAHVSLMATTTTDDFHTVYDDEELCVGDYLQHAQAYPRAPPLYTACRYAHSVPSAECAYRQADVTRADRGYIPACYCHSPRLASRILPPTADSWCSTASHAARCALWLSWPSRPT